MDYFNDKRIFRKNLAYLVIKSCKKQLNSYNILQIANCIEPNKQITIIGKRPGEKLHELMISNSESYKTIIKDTFYIILPEIIINKNYELYYGNNYMNENDEYSSGCNQLIDNSELQKLLNNVTI